MCGFVGYFLAGALLGLLFPWWIAIPVLVVGYYVDN